VAISAVIVVGYLALHFFVTPPEQTQTTPPAQTTSQTTSVHSPEDNISDSLVTGLERREGVYNILLAATDKDGYRTDTMMVLCYDIPNQKIGVVSVPRDTITDRETGTDPRLVYGSGGVTQRVEDISTMLGVPIDYYVKVNINGFIALVDYLDGVDFYVPCDMDYDDPFQDLHIHYKEGTQHLSGQQAMEVSRFRKNNADSSGNSTGYSDVGRTQTQQKLLVALAKKVLSWGSLTKINGFVEIFNTYVDTDLSMTDMLYFASQAASFDLSNVETTTLEGRGDGVYHGKTWCYELDPESTVETVNQLINPYNQDLTLDDMRLVSADRYMS
jgi:LCP family protein required for cell wall assembly